MALPNYRQSGNISRTIQIAFADPTITAYGGDWTVYWDYRWGDPDEANDPTATADRAFVLGTWLEERAGRRGTSVIQLDVYSRIGAPGDADGDPYGLRARAIADALEEVWTSTGPSGALNACRRVLDFTDPLAPVETEETVWCRSSDGNLGEVEGRSPAGVEHECWRISLTFRFLLARDAAGISALYY